MWHVPHYMKQALHQTNISVTLLLNKGRGRDLIDNDAGEPMVLHLAKQGRIWLTGEDSSLPARQLTSQALSKKDTEFI